MIRQLNVKPYKSSLVKVSKFLDNFEFKKVKTKYTKGDDWTALSFHGYGNHPLDILKPGVLKSSVKIDTKLQYTTLINLEEMKPILEYTFQFVQMKMLYSLYMKVPKIKSDKNII